MTDRLIEISAAGSWTHGCRDYAVVRVLEDHDDTADVVVLEAGACQSCWQVGHTNDHIFAPAVGEVVVINNEGESDGRIESRHFPYAEAT